MPTQGFLDAIVATLQNGCQSDAAGGDPRGCYYGTKRFWRSGWRRMLWPGSDPGLQSEHYDVHGEVIHLACISDLLVTAIRKPTDRPWGIPEPTRMGEGSLWASSAYLDHSGSHLRRVVGFKLE